MVFQALSAPDGTNASGVVLVRAQDVTVLMTEGRGEGGGEAISATWLA